MKRTFMPQNDADRLLWLQNFSGKLAGYQVKYNLSAADIARVAASFLVFNYWVNYVNQFKEFVSKLTRYRTELTSGVPAGGSASVEPVPPSLGVAPPPVDPGIFVFVSALAQTIKANINYTVADGKDLGLEGEEVAQDNVNDMKPLIQLRLVNGGHPEIVWKRKSADGIDIYVDRGAGSFVFLATDTVPNYTDTFTLPAGAAVWKYRCIYRIDDAPVGQWSDTISITVSGV